MSLWTDERSLQATIGPAAGAVDRFTTIFSAPPGRETSAKHLETPVSEVMHRGVVSLPATATLADAAAAMRDNKIHAVLITRSDGSPLGWVTSRGILHNHAREWTTEASAANAITQPAASVAPTATLADALTVFVATRASHILVGASAAEPPIGVIADSDLVAFMA